MTLWAKWCMEKLRQQWGNWHLCLVVTQYSVFPFLPGFFPPAPSSQRFFLCCALMNLSRRRNHSAAQSCVFCAPHVAVFLMYLLVCVCVSGTCVKEIKLCARKTERRRWCTIALLHSLLFYPRIIAILPRMIANSYDFPRKGGGRVWVKAAEGGGKSKQMAKH